LKLPSSNTGLLPPTNYKFTQLPTFSPLPATPDTIQSLANFHETLNLRITDDEGWGGGGGHTRRYYHLLTSQKIGEPTTAPQQTSRSFETDVLERRLFTQGQSNIPADAWHLHRTSL
jgi:hypothetical protein